MMIGAIRNLFTKPQATLNPSLNKMLVTLEATEPVSDKMNGWLSFIEDALPGLKRKADALEYLKGTGLCKYELELRKVIAGQIYKRTGRHPDLDHITLLEREAACSYDHISQLAYNCMLYEEQLLQSPTQEHLEALREITAEIA